MNRRRPKKLCSVKNCRETDELHKSRSYHFLPINPKRAAKWIEKIPYLEEGSVLCDRHFTADDYDYRKVKIKLTAIPSLFLEISPPPSPPPPPPEPEIIEQPEVVAEEPKKVEKEKRCIVQYCEEIVHCEKDSDEVIGRRRSFHPFPQTEDSKKLWLEAIGKLAKQVPRKAFVCSRHFVSSDYCGVSLLKATAIPSQNLPRQSRTDRVEKRKCIVKNCEITDPHHANRSFHTFPKNPEKKVEWFKAINMDPDSRKFFNTHICDRHFVGSDYTINRLCKNAIPTKDLQIADVSFEEQMKLLIGPKPEMIAKSKELEQNMLLDEYTALLTKNNQLKTIIDEIKSENLELKLFIERYK